MRLKVKGSETYVATGGKPFDASLPTLVFLHGSGLDHRTWALQTRWFAFRGWSVVAPDLPGHSLSRGRPLTSIEKMADWTWHLLDALGVTNASLIGHSQGALVALEAAARQSERSTSLSLIATGGAIPVNPQLLDTAKTNRPAAVDAMLTWGFGESYQFGKSDVPGQAPLAIGNRIMCANPLEIDLQACQNYTNGENAANKVSCPTQLILALNDRMTPLKAGRQLATQLPNVKNVAEIDAGHMLPIEAPENCLNELRNFITALD
jgi:pimeloyl-ACP methyl ester carboxylesterase